MENAASGGRLRAAAPTWYLNIWTTAMREKMVSQFTVRRLVKGLLLLPFLAMIGVQEVSAQRPPDETGDIILDAAGAGPDYNATAARRSAGFDLFATADAAITGMGGTGNLVNTFDNYGPCVSVLVFCRYYVFPARGGGAFVSFQMFETVFAAGAPPTDFVKLRQLAPSASNAKGGGYTYHNGIDGLFASFRPEWGPKDLTLGTLFSGEVSSSDGSCLDMSATSEGFFGGGLQLLAGSDCPPTWPQGVFQGGKPIPKDSWLIQCSATAMAPCDDTFDFEFWRMPDSLKIDKFHGTNFATYGETTTHSQEILEGYGSILPGGAGDPAFDGWPLGLEWHFEAFNFGVPAVASVNFFQAIIINKTEEVYGVGVDYDSLYLGFQVGTGGSGGGGGQRFSDYFLPEISTFLFHQSYAVPGGPCGDGSRIPPGVSSCAGGTDATRGWNNGGNAHIILKSPIGDLRYKHFSDPTSDFFSPGHENVGDTITFNHGHQCGFGGCWANTHNVSDKRSFGMISSTADNVLDGRNPGSLTGSEPWRTFRNFGYPAVQGVFNHYVPGVEGPPAATWDYNHDLIPDTLFFDSCHIFGCVTASADTAPGGQVNSYGNVGGIVAAGPFQLAAGDTTSWVVAFVGDADSATTWASINAAIDLYMNFFLAPEAPPPAEILSTTVVPGTSEGFNQEPSISIFFSEAPETWVDAFLAKQAADIAAAPPGTPLEQLRLDNPGLVAAINAQAADNLEAIEIYKSCDAGATFTSDADCIGDPATGVDGSSIALGWQSYATLTRDDFPGGDIPNRFVDATVLSGREFLYSFVGKSRGGTFAIVDAGGFALPDLVLAPSIRNALSRAGPSVAKVYVPTGRPAGFEPARAGDLVVTGGSTVPFEFTFSEDVLAAAYRATFGNNIIVERDSNITTDAVLETRVRLQHTLTADVGGVATPTVVRENVFTRTDDVVVPIAGAGGAPSTATVGSIETTSVTYAGLGFVVANTSTSVPYFASISLVGDAATPTAVFALPDFAGFTIRADNTVAGDYISSPPSEHQLRGQLSKDALTRGEPGEEAVSDTVPRGAVDEFMVQWVQAASAFVAGGGDYRVIWTDEAFGLPRGITPNFSNPAVTSAELSAALRAREVGSTGLTDAATAALVGLAQSDLVAVKAPFTIRNESFGRDVQIAMARRFSDRLLLGVLLDTVRVDIPFDQWVPGDALFFIEPVEEDSTTAVGVVLGTGGTPIKVTHETVTFSPAVFGCDTPRIGCNPVGALSRGQSGYLAQFPGDSTVFGYFAAFTVDSRFDFNVVPPVTVDDITAVTDSMMALIQVVPNPFVVFSQYQTSITSSRVLFTNVPPMGKLRIYTVSGQFVQQVEWTQADLQSSGDLAYNLRSREDIDIASGLYIWVITAPSNPQVATSAPIRARGKFVVIRGDNR